MSDDSSNTSFVTEKPVRPLPGWQIAVMALLAVILLYFAAQVFGAVLVGIFGSMNHWSMDQTNAWLESSVAAQFIFGVVVYGFLLMGVWVLLRLFQWSWTTIGLTKLKIWQIGVGIVAAVPYYILYAVILGIVSHFIPSFNIDQKQNIGFTSVHGFGQLALTFVSLVIIPPLVEEITMRGFLYTSLKRWMSIIPAALLVSVLFGAAHLPEGGSAGPLWVGAIDTFTLSLVLIYLRERTGSLWSGITLHAVKNGVAFVVLYLMVGH